MMIDQHSKECIIHDIRLDDLYRGNDTDDVVISNLDQDSISPRLNALTLGIRWLQQHAQSKVRLA